MYWATSTRGNEIGLATAAITQAIGLVATVSESESMRLPRPAADVGALEDLLARVSVFAMHMEARMAELDINPVMVLPEGRGLRDVA